ncbi:MAG TPA: hypothetical protein EYP56_10480, partial [Planctomycetaceae bacterium]|nr:hypothetical protein [Planctomycetaceae bacterium]
MKPLRFTDRFKTLFKSAVELSHAAGAEAVLLLLDAPADWNRLAKLAGPGKLLVAVDTLEMLEGAREAGLQGIALQMPDSPVYDRITQALLEAVADDLLSPGASVVAWRAAISLPKSRISSTTRTMPLCAKSE